MSAHEIDVVLRQERSIAAIQYMRIALDALGCVQVFHVLCEAERHNFDRLYNELAGMLSEMRSESGLPHKAVPVSKLESGAHLPVSELAEAERKPG
jgi:hypothetical protein